MFWYEGVGIRPVEVEDLESIRHLRNEESTWKYLTHVKQINEYEQKEWFKRISINTDEAYYTVVAEERLGDAPVSGEGDFLGIARMRNIDVTNRSIQVGCDIMPDKRGLGWGTKTFHVILKYCFDYLNMHRVWLCVVENNDVAIRLYYNVGFKEEGKYRDAIFRDGKYLDYIVMSILEDEYKK